MAAKYLLTNVFLDFFFWQSHEKCSFEARSLSSVEKYEEKTLGSRHCKNAKNENINNGIK